MSVIVKEYLEIDSRSLNLSQRPSPPICGQSAHRYVHNPLRNFIFDLLSAGSINQEFASGSELPMTKSRMISLPNAHLLLPECDICGYLSMPMPQYFTSTYLTKASTKIGIVKGLPTENISQISFLDCTGNPTFSTINVYLTYDLCNFPDYFTSTTQERHDKCHNIVKLLSDEHYAEPNLDIVDDDLSDTSQAILNNMLKYWPTDIPAFPIDTINRSKITTSHYVRNFYPSHALPYAAKHIELLRFSKEFTSIEFPPGYGIQLSGSDLIPSKWYWSNEILPSVKSQLAADEKVAIELTLTIAPDWNKLYETLSSLLVKNGKSQPEAISALNKKISQYGFPPFLTNKQNIQKTKNMKELYVTWVGSNNLFSIPSGRSLHYGNLTCLPTAAQLISFVPYFMDHTACMELWVEKNAKAKRLYSFTPNNSNIASSHLPTPKFLDFGPLSKKHELHTHAIAGLSDMKNGHLAVGGLQKATIHRPNGWIIRSFDNVFFRIRAYYDNLHDVPIENCAMCAIYWTPVPNKMSLPRSSTDPKLVCPDHMNNYQVPMSNKITTEEHEFINEKSASKVSKSAEISNPSVQSKNGASVKDNEAKPSTSVKDNEQKPSTSVKENAEETPSASDRGNDDAGPSTSVKENELV